MIINNILLNKLIIMINILLIYSITLLLQVSMINSIFLKIDPQEDQCFSRDMTNSTINYFGGYFQITNGSESDVEVYMTKND